MKIISVNNIHVVLATESLDSERFAFLLKSLLGCELISFFQSLLFVIINNDCQNDLSFVNSTASLFPFSFPHLIYYQTRFWTKTLASSALI